MSPTHCNRFKVENKPFYYKAMEVFYHKLQMLASFFFNVKKLCVSEEKAVQKVPGHLLKIVKTDSGGYGIP